MSNLILNNFTSLNICLDQLLNLHELFVDIFIWGEKNNKENNRECRDLTCCILDSLSKVLQFI